MNKKGKLTSGQDIIRSIAVMHDRSNGLGGGFAAYGIYPEFKDDFAFHFFFDSKEAKEAAEVQLNKYFTVVYDEPVPVREMKAIKDAPVIWRYFVQPKAKMMMQAGLPEDEYVVKFVMKTNSELEGAYIFSSGKNMGAFKGVGYPEDIGEFYRLDEYRAWLWTAHGRFPTNTPGWWGGAHPFTLLECSVVHNGEISSYDANRRFLEMYGYRCTLLTDTEVMAYIFDFLTRKQGLSLEVVVMAMASPFWQEIDRMEPGRKETVKAVRAVYGSLLVNGPFSILVGTSQGMIALNDRIKLRPCVAATKGDFLYVASEEAGIREVCPKPDKIWAPRGGEPIIGLLENAASQYGPAQGSEKIAINS
jgi:glutamate synthase domain-containing protein 1